MRRTILFVLVTVASLPPTSRMTGQTGSTRVTVPSPTAASLGKFGDVPVSLYTGVPDISIPLFTAKGRTLELPIVLRYHAGGVKVEEIGGWAGIGWTLEAGGTITRTVRGLVDEYGAGYYTTGYAFYDGANWPNPTNFTILDQIRNEQLDGEPDRFFFDIAGRSGQFVMGPTGPYPSLQEVRTIPYQNVRIEPTISSAGAITRFVITTEDGTRYTLDSMETSTDWSTGLEDSRHWGESYASSWFLTEIRSPGGDVINLFYTPYTARHRLGTNSESFHRSEEHTSNGTYTVTKEFAIRTQRLDSIKSAAHTIKFHTTLRGDALSPTDAQQEPQLDSLTVTTPTGAVLRVFKLEHDYGTGRLTLTNVYERDRNGVPLPPYTFSYSTPLLPVYSSNSQDHWGYYNGKDNPSGLIPTTTAPGGNVIP